MAEKKFGKKIADKLNDVFNVQTVANKAAIGNIDRTVSEVIKNSETTKVLQYLGTIFYDGKKMTGTDVGAMMNTMSQPGNNVLTKIRVNTDKISTSVQEISKLLTNSLKIQDKYFDNAINVESNGSADMVIALDTSKAENFDKIIDAIAGIDDDVAKRFATMVKTARDLGFVELNDLEEVFVNPLNKLTNLKNDEIISKIKNIQDNDLFGSLKNIFNELSNLPVISEDKSVSFAILDTFMASMVKLNGIDTEELYDVNDKFDIMTAIICAEGSNNLKDILQNLSEIDVEIDDTVAESVKKMAEVFTNIAEITKIITNQATDEIFVSLDNYNNIIDKLKSITEFTKEDAERLNESSERTKECIASMSSNSENMYSALKKSAENSESSQKFMERIMDAHNKNKDKIDEIKEDAEDSKNVGVIIDGLGSTILKIGAVMLIGTMFIKKDPQFLKNTIIFGASLAAFSLMVVTPLMLLGVIGGQLEASGDAVSALGTAVIKLGGILLVAALIYRKFGQKFLSRSAELFIADMTKFVTGVVLVLAIASLISRSADRVNAIGNVVTKLSFVMMIGALFMLIKNGQIAKNALLFGVVLMAFMFMIALPIRFLTRGGIFSNSIEAMDDVSQFVLTCSMVMMVGALFMMIKNGQLWKNALIFGAILTTFITMLLIPVMLLTGNFGKGLAVMAALSQFTKFVQTTAIILMVGGLFMILAGGRLAKGALQFAALLSLFIISVSLALKLLVVGMGINAVRIIKRFKQAIEMMAIILMVGGLLMLVPGFPKRVMQFALLMTVFTMAMAAIFIVVGHVMSRQAIVKSLLFTTAVMMLVLVVTWSVMSLSKISWGQFLKSVGFLLLTIAMFVGVICLLGTPLIKRLVGQGLLVMLLIGVALLAFAGALLIISIAASKLKMSDFLLLTIAIGLLVGIFAIIGIPYVALLVAIGAVVMLAIGVALMILAVDFLIIHLIVSRFDLAKDMWNLTTAVAAIQPMFILLSLMIPAILIGSIAATLLGAALSVLSIGFILVHVAALFDIKADAKKLVAGINAVKEVFIELGKNVVYIVLGDVAGVLLGVALTSLGIGFTVLHLISLFDSVADAKEVSKGLWALMDVFSALGILSPFIIFGSIAATSLGASLTVLGVAFGVINICTRDLELEKIELINSALKMFMKTFTLLSLMIPIILIGSVAATTLSASLMLISGAFEIVHLVGSQEGLNKDIQVIDKGVRDIQQTFAFMLKNTLSITLGSVVGLALATSASAIGLAFRAIHRTIEEAPDLATDIETFGNNLVNICKVFTEKMDEIDFTKLFFTTLKVKYTMHPIIRLASELFGVIKDFATLMIPDKWDKTTGNPIGYRQLKSTDFKDAAESITKVFETLINGISGIKVDQTILNDFKSSGEASGFLGRLFRSGKSDFSAIVRMSSMVIRLVGEAGEAMANMAQLMIPTRWNSDGVPIKYRTLGKEDFANAAEGVKSIMTTMFLAVADVGKAHENLIKDFLDEGSDSIFTGIVKMSRGISEMLSEMAGGIADFANLRIPTKWGSDGKPTKWMTIADKDFENVGKNIDAILSCVIDAVKKSYEKWFGPSNYDAGSRRGRKEARRQAETAAAQGDAMSAIICAIGDAVNLVSNTAKIVSDIAKLRIPVYNNNSVDPIGYRAITNQDFVDMSTNVETILTEIPKAIRTAYNKMPKIGVSLSEIMDEFTPMSDFLANLVQCMKDYASMSQLPVLDKDGKIDHYIPFDYDTVLGNMGTNVGKLITGMSAAIIVGWEMFKTLNPDKEPKYLGEIIDAISPIGDFLSDLVNTIIAYANLRVPKYQGDKIVGYYDLINNQEEMGNLFDKMSSNIQKIMSGVIGAANTALSSYMTKEGKEELKNLADAADNFTEVMKPITEVLNLVKSYIELKFPNGPLDKDGKPTSYMTLMDFTSDKFTKFEDTIAQMITAVPNAVWRAIMATAIPMSTIFGENEFTSLSTFTSRIMEISTMMKSIRDIINGFAAMKIPVGFDKDGKPNKYMQLTAAEFTALSANIEAMLMAIPLAITNVINNPNLQFDDEMVKKLGNFIYIVDNATYLIGNFYSETHLKELDDYMKNSIQYIFSMSIIAANTHVVRTILTENLFRDMIYLFSYIDLAFSDNGMFNHEKRQDILTVASSVMEQFGSLIDILTYNDKSSNVILKSMTTAKLLNNVKNLGIVYTMLKLALANSKLLYEINEQAYKLDADPFFTMNGILNEIIDNTKIYKVNSIQVTKFKLLSAITSALKESAEHLQIIDNSIYNLRENPVYAIDEIYRSLVSSTLFKDKLSVKDIKKFGEFALITYSLSNSAASLKEASVNLSNVHQENFEKIKNILDDVNTAMSNTDEKDIKKLEKESIALQRYSKAINSIQVEKINSLSRLFSTMSNFASSVGNLTDFTKVLANEVSVALNDLTNQITDAKKVITTAEKQRDKRQEALDKSIERIDKLMSKPLTVNIESGNDKLGAAYENPND